MAGEEVTSEAASGAASRAAQAFYFSTDTFREHERVAAWRELFGRTLLNIDIAPRSKERFHATATISRSAALSIIRATTAPADQSNRGLIANDDISFGCVLSGRWFTSQRGRAEEVLAGDGVLLSHGDVGTVSFLEASDFVAFGLPRSAVAPLVPDIDALFARRVPGSNPALRMLLHYLEFIADEGLNAAPELQAALANHVGDLLALSLGATRDATELARRRGLVDARLRAIKEDVRKSYHRADLSVHTVAARHGVSARYVQRIFDESGSTFTQYLTEQRLAAAHNVLRRPTAAALPISTIAFDCGFSDVSHFNRLFRRRYGCTPSDVRRTNDAAV